MTPRSKGYLANPELHRIGKISPMQLLPLLSYVMPLLRDPCPPCEGTGIVMVAGGKYLRWAYASIRKTREVTDLPIQIWHLGEAEVTPEDRRKFDDLDVEFVNAHEFLDEFPMHRLGGWECKSYAVAHCPFRQVILLDADCHPIVDPEPLFETQEFKDTGIIMWPDLNKCRKDDMIFPCMGLAVDPDFQEMEAGQLLVDKKRLWEAVRFTVWMNSHSEAFYQIAFGDKDLHQMALRKLGLPFSVGDIPDWIGSGMVHRFRGEPVFRHLMEGKRSSGHLLPSDYVELLGEFELLNLQTA